MKGADVINATGTTYGNISGINEAGQYEFVKISAIAGNLITLQTCLKKSYTISGKVQMVSVPQFSGNQTVAAGDKVSAIRIVHKGYGYLSAPIVTIAAPTGPLLPKVTATAVAEVDGLGQLKAIRITNPGSGYNAPPAITIASPPAPYAFSSYRATASARIGLTCLPWDGDVGGILAFHVEGDLTLNDSINVSGMGFHGGTLATSPGSGTCYTNDFTAFGNPASATVPETELVKSGVKGEGIALWQTNHYRGRGKWANGGGAGGRGEAGGGGGGNYGAGGQGGNNGSNAVFLCTGSAGSGRAGLGLAGFGYGSGVQDRLFLGGGGGGGQAYNGTFSSAFPNNCGGAGGGIILISANSITGNNRAIKANGGSTFTIVSDGASGGGGAGAVLIQCPIYSGNLTIEARGGKGGNTDRLSCCTSSCPTSACSNKEGPGGGGGGGVVWLSASALPAGVTSVVSGGTGGLCIDQGNDPYGAQSGGNGQTLFNLDLYLGGPFTGNFYTVGPQNLIPKPNFETLADAANLFYQYGNESLDVTLEVKSGTYPQPVLFRRMNDGCNPTAGTITVQSETGLPADVVVGAINDAITIQNLERLTLKNLSVQAAANTSRAILVHQTARLDLDQVNITGGLELSATGTNQSIVQTSVHSGSVTVAANASFEIQGSCEIQGQNPSNHALTLASGAQFLQGPGSLLFLNGANWINQGAALNLNASSVVSLGGNVPMQIAGPASTTFRRCWVSNSNSIQITAPVSMKAWRQTSSIDVQAGSNLVTITDSVQTGPGRIQNTAGGKVLVSGSGLPSQVQGRFSRLELANPQHQTAFGTVSADDELRLQQGRLDAGSNLITLDNAASGALVQNPGSWINGTFRRRINAGLTYQFPVGTAASVQLARVEPVSLNSGIQFLDVRFLAQNPNLHPLASGFVPDFDGASIYSGLLTNGYWNLSPDAGNLVFHLWLYPDFYSTQSPFSFYRRSAAPANWILDGDLSNPESTTDYIQSDGSVRRNNLPASGDFAIAESDNDPLPIGFTGFQAVQKESQVFLHWDVGFSRKPEQFRIWKKTGNQPFVHIGGVIQSKNDAETAFGYSDAASLLREKVVYRIDMETQPGIWTPGPVRALVFGQKLESDLRFSPAGNGTWYCPLHQNTPSAQVRIYDATGRLVHEQEITSKTLLKLPGGSGNWFHAWIWDGQQTHHQTLLRQ